MKKQLLLLLAFTSAFAMNAQVTLVKEINDSGTSSSFPASLTTFGGKIYFTADDSNGSNTPGGVDLGKELWITDGTEGGTTFVKDINIGDASSNIFNPFVFNGSFYFNANDGAGEIWTSNGTEGGTTKVDIIPSIGGESPQLFRELNGVAYFKANSLPDGANKLIEWDGTNDAVQVADVGSGFEVVGTDFIGFNNKLILYMNYSTDDATIGTELYEYDPATDTFTLIKDITGDDANSGISGFTVVGSELYFEALGALWKTDGTEGGTLAVISAASLGGVRSLVEFNGKVFFEGDNGDGATNDQLYAYDPVGDTVTNVSNITGSVATGGNNHDPEDYAELDGYLYYRGETFDNSLGYVFRTDGTTSEQLDATIKDIDEITVLNGKLYFEGDDGVSGNELYSFDPATLSVGNNQAEIVRVFPNPTSDYIMVSKQLLKAPYAIHDITGKTVKEGIITNERIDFNLSSGLYLFKVKTELSTITKKIIIK